MTAVIMLDENFGYTPIKITELASTVIDASDAIWVLANFGDELNRYPFSVRESDDVTILGGTINGEVPLDLDWEDAYINSAAVYIRDVSNVVIRDWNISQAWDAIRIRGENSNSFTIDRVWLSDIRDDGVENDDGLSGTISNSLFDGVFVGISLADNGTTDKTDNLVTLDNVLIRMKAYEYKGEITHQPILKVDGNVSPRLSIHDSVFAIEDVNHHTLSGMAEAWDTVVSASGNYFLNLSDDPLPAYYPLPPSGFIVLQGQLARDYWHSVRAEWIEEYVAEEKSTGTTGDDTLTGSADANLLDGLNGDDALFGYAGDDVLRGGIGDDSLNGGGDKDMLYGGDGADFANGGNGDDVIFGGSGNDTLYGKSGADTIYGAIGADQLMGGAGDDELHGGAHADRLLGGNGADILSGGTGDDTLNGGYGVDILNGENGNDALFGGSDDDILDGGHDDDRIYGGSGLDNLSGGDGNDVLFGGNEADILFGGAGNDKLYGGEGDDVLQGGQGNDVLIGKAGSDTFVFSDGFGQDVINDFERGVDKLKFSSDLWVGNLDETEVIMQFSYSEDERLIFDFGNGNTLNLLGYEDATLVLNDLILV